MKCKRPSCKAQGRPIYCSPKCACQSGWAKVNGHGRKPAKPPGKSVAVPKDSWWTTDPAEFYTNAHERFPETGAAIVERGKVFMYAKDSKAGGARKGRTE